MFTQIFSSGPSLCSRLTPISEFRELYAALVCGVNLSGGEVKQLFIDTGLIHILVVSGAHLGTLERISRRAPKIFTNLILCGYCWLTGFGAPVVRAGVTRLLRPFTHARGFGPVQTEFVTSAVIVLCYPPWILSRSFLMSWLCVLALKMPLPRTPFTARVPSLVDGLRCYLFLYPFCLGHPLTVVWNCLVAPLIGGVLFPLATLAFAWPATTGLIDYAWVGTLWILRTGPRAGAEGPLVLTAWLWWLPWVLNTILMWTEWTWRRARAFS